MCSGWESNPQQRRPAAPLPIGLPEPGLTSADATGPTRRRVEDRVPESDRLSPKSHLGRVSVPATRSPAGLPRHVHNAGTLPAVKVPRSVSVLYLAHGWRTHVSSWATGHGSFTVSGAGRLRSGFSRLATRIPTHADLAARHRSLRRRSKRGWHIFPITAPDKSCFGSVGSTMALPNRIWAAWPVSAPSSVHFRPSFSCRATKTSNSSSIAFAVLSLIPLPRTLPIPRCQQPG